MQTLMLSSEHFFKTNGGKPQTPSNPFTKETHPEPPLVPSTNLLPPYFTPHFANCPAAKYPETMAAKYPETIAAKTPVEVGTRGTVGSLVMKEIEYFNRLELGRHGSGRSHKAQVHGADVASGTTGRSRHSFWFLIMTWRRKKKRRNNSSTFLPSICSVVEVADCHGLSGISGFNYRILNDDL